jgi:O-antigen ligase
VGELNRSYPTGILLLGGLRVTTWAASLEGWAESPTFGNGYGWYGEIAKFANDLTAVSFNGHNLFVHAMVTGGIVLVIALGLLAWRLIVVATGEAGKGRLFPMAYTLSFFVIAVLEVPTRFRDVDPQSWVSVIPLIIIAMNSRKSVQSEPCGGIETTQRKLLLPSR